MKSALPKSPFLLTGFGSLLLLAVTSVPSTVVSADLAVSSLSLAEGNSPASPPFAFFTLQLSPVAATETVWEYTTASDTAREGEDYQPARGTVSIPAGQGTATVMVPLVADVQKEETESFSLIVWPQGTAPVPALTSIPKPPQDNSKPLFEWSQTLCGVSEGNWFNGKWVGQHALGIWEPTREIGDFGRPVYSPKMVGDRMVWADLFEFPAGHTWLRLGMAERQREGFNPWDTAANVLVKRYPYGQSCAVSGDFAAVGGDNQIVLYQLLHHHAPRLRARIPLPSNIKGGSPKEVIAFSGKRIAVVVGTPPEVKIYEATDAHLTTWQLKTTLPATDGPLAMEGDLLMGRDASAGFTGGYRIFSRNAGGPDNWGQTTTLLPPAPELISYYSPAVMRGGLVMIGDAEAANGTETVAEGKIHTFTRDLAGDGWSYAGAFTSPSPGTADRFGTSLGHGGHDLISSSASFYRTFSDSVPAKAWGGSFAGARATILDDDLPTVSLLRISGFEPSNGPVILTGGVELSHESTTPVTVTWTASDGTARAGVDYSMPGGQITIPAGTLMAPLQITVLPDDVVEADETFSITVTAVSGAVWDNKVGDCLIRDTERQAIVHATAPLI